MNTQSSESNSNHAAADALPPSLSGKFFALSLLLLAVGLAAGFYFFLMPLLNTVLSGLATAPQIVRLQSVFALLACIALVAGLLTIRAALCIKRAGQTPLNNRLLWQTTLIKRGAAAARIARIYLAIGIATVLITLALAIYIGIALQRIAPLPSLRPGVTLLPEKSSF